MAKKIPVVGLDVGSRTLKLCKIEDSKKGNKVTKLGMRDIPPGLIEEGMIKDSSGVAEGIKQLFKAYKVKEKNVALSIGGYSIIVKTISLQNMPEKELQETIHFEAEQYIPFDISDVNLDFQILGDDPDNPNQMNVLLVAAKKEIVNDYVKLIQTAGLNPVIIDVDAFALQNIYEANYDIDDNDNVALIDIGVTKTTLNILKGNASVLIRDISLGCGQINQKLMSQIGCSLEEAEQLYSSEEGKSPEAEEVVVSVATDWCVEIRRVLDYFYSTYPSDQVQKIVLAGGGANIKQFQKFLHDEASIDVEVINPFAKLGVSGLDSYEIERIGSQAAICLGLAMRRVDDK